MSLYFCNYSKLLVQTTDIKTSNKCSNVQIKDKAPEITKEIKINK